MLQDAPDEMFKYMIQCITDSVNSKFNDANTATVCQVGDCLFVCASVRVFVHLFVCAFVCLFAYFCVCSFVCSFVCAFVCLDILFVFPVRFSVCTSFKICLAVIYWLI